MTQHLWVLCLLLGLMRTRAGLHPQKLGFFTSKLELCHLVMDEAVLCFYSSKSYHFASNSPLCGSLKCFSCDTVEESYFQTGPADYPRFLSKANHSFINLCSMCQTRNKERFNPTLSLHYHAMHIFIW